MKYQHIGLTTTKQIIIWVLLFVYRKRDAK